MNKGPSFFKIIFTDYAAFMSITFPVISWAIYLYLFWFNQEEASYSSLPIVFGVITIIALFVLAWRIILINRLFAEGVEISATISKIFFYRNRGRIDCTYSYMGQEFSNSNRVIKNKYTTSLDLGTVVVMVIDPNNPKRALIRDLFV